MQSEMIQESTGSQNLNTNTENSEDWPQPANQEEDSELKVTWMPRPDHQEEPTTREETWSNLEDSDDQYLNNYFLLTSPFLTLINILLLTYILIHI